MWTALCGRGRTRIGGRMQRFCCRSHAVVVLVALLASAGLPGATAAPQQGARTPTRSDADWPGYNRSK